MSDVSYRQDRSAISLNSVGTYPSSADTVDLYSAVCAYGQECSHNSSRVYSGYRVLQRSTKAGHKYMQCEVDLAGVSSATLLPEAFEGYPVVTVAITVETVIGMNAVSSICLPSAGVTMKTVDRAIAIRHGSGMAIILTVTAGNVSDNISIRFYLQYEPSADYGVCRFGLRSMRLSNMPPAPVQRSRNAADPDLGFVKYTTQGRRLMCDIGVYVGRPCRFTCMAESAITLTIGRFSMEMERLEIVYFDLMVTGQSILTALAVRCASGLDVRDLTLHVKCSNLWAENYVFGAEVLPECDD